MKFRSDSSPGAGASAGQSESRPNAGKLAYFVNQYPKVSHSFIRREILALERMGFEIERFALRGWDAELVDPDDLAERQRTRFVLRGGLISILGRLARKAVLHPGRFFRGVALALKLSRQSDRSIALHLVSVAEAAMLVQDMRKRGVKHIHAHFGTNSAEVVMLASVMGGPSYSFTVHGSAEWDMPLQLKLREKVHSAAFVIAISSYTRAQLWRWSQPEDWAKIHIVHCGLDQGFHAVAPSPVPDVARLVCVGRLCKEKAQVLLVEAVAALRRQGKRVDLVLAGDGELRGELEALIGRHGLNSQVRITGWISSADVREEILAARALVLPSFMEALPVVLMEAMALRRPVLTTLVGGIPELVRDGLDGWLFSAGSIEGLVDAINKCLDADVGALTEMGNRARTRALQRHDVDVEAGRLAPLFHAHLEGMTQSVPLPAAR